MVAWGALSAVRKISAPEKIRVALLLQTPMMSQSTPRPIIPPKNITPAPITPTHSKPAETPLIQKTPAPPVMAAIKPIAASAALPTIAPALIKTPAAEPVPPKAPSPPPAINVQANYEEENLGRIRTLLAERLKYPKNALRLRQQGTVNITFTLSPSGDVSGITINKSSDFDMLDDAARELIESTASAFPKPSKSVRITIPIEYKIR
jgi:periplasmic protein TonB